MYAIKQLYVKQVFEFTMRAQEIYQRLKVYEYLIIQ